MWLKVVVFMYFVSIWPNTNAKCCKLNDIISNGDLTFHDLSYEFDSNTIYWPKGRPFEFTKQDASLKKFGWYAANEFGTAEHGGTHMDAPYHFYKEGKFVGQIPVEKLILPLIIMDISSLVNGDPNFVLQKHHVDHLLNDNLGKPCMIIFRFGWSQFYGNRTKYLGLNEVDGTLNFPGLSEEIAVWLTTSHRNVLGVGVDVASLDPGSVTTFPVHKILLAAGVYGMELVKMDSPLPHHGCTGIALPMKIAKGTGGPLRLVAICPNQEPTTC